MPEQKKSSHGQAFDFDALMDEQITSWPDMSNWSPARRKMFGSPPATVDLAGQIHYRPVLPQEQAAGYVKPEVERLFAEQPQDDVRAAFRLFLEKSGFHCHRCANKVEAKTLKVPPPTMSDGHPIFHMYCSPECAADGCTSEHS